MLLGVFSISACAPSTKTQNVSANSGGSIPATSAKSELVSSVIDTGNTIALNLTETSDISVELEPAESAKQVPAQFPEQSVPANMALIPGGSFAMGNDTGDRDEKPVHAVTLHDFYMGKYEVTQKEYAAIMGNNPSGFKGDNLPVDKANWFEAVEYCNRLSEKEGLTLVYQGEGEAITCDFTASGYRLPTEAEWEYAAAGRNADFNYSGSDTADAVGWYNANSNGKPCEVGTKAANGFGLYDMSGNVSEWCWDRYGSYSTGDQDAPTGVLSGKNRVVRGGSWGNSAWNLRLSGRSYNVPSTRNSGIGFRIVRSPL
jgi:formylglycine-generating enzyme required for sulfatase activity